jgi:hypothetical protein
MEKNGNSKSRSERRQCLEESRHDMRGSCGTYDWHDRAWRPPFTRHAAGFLKIRKTCTHIRVGAWVAPQWQPGGSHDCRIGLFGIVRISTGKLAQASLPGDGVDNVCRCARPVVRNRFHHRERHAQQVPVVSRASFRMHGMVPAGFGDRRTSRQPSSRPDRAARAVRSFMRKEALDAICALWPALPCHASGIPPPTLLIRVHPCIRRPEHRTD